MKLSLFGILPSIFFTFIGLLLASTAPGAVDRYPGEEQKIKSDFKTPDIDKKYGLHWQLRIEDRYIIPERMAHIPQRKRRFRSFDSRYRLDISHWGPKAETGDKQSQYSSDISISNDQIFQSNHSIRVQKDCLNHSVCAEPDMFYAPSISFSLLQNFWETHHLDKSLPLSDLDHYDSYFLSLRIQTLQDKLLNVFRDLYDGLTIARLLKQGRWESLKPREDYSRVKRVLWHPRSHILEINVHGLPIDLEMEEIFSLLEENHISVALNRIADNTRRLLKGKSVRILFQTQPKLLLNVVGNAHEHLSTLASSVDLISNVGLCRHLKTVTRHLSRTSHGQVWLHSFVDTLAQALEEREMPHERKCAIEMSFFARDASLPSDFYGKMKWEFVIESLIRGSFMLDGQTLELILGRAFQREHTYLQSLIERQLMSSNPAVRHLWQKAFVRHLKASGRKKSSYQLGIDLQSIVARWLCHEDGEIRREALRLLSQDHLFVLIEPLALSNPLTPYRFISKSYLLGLARDAAEFPWFHVMLSINAQDKEYAHLKWVLKMADQARERLPWMNSPFFQSCIELLSHRSFPIVPLYSSGDLLRDSSSP